jgi:hypothetical protein
MHNNVIFLAFWLTDQTFRIGDVAYHTITLRLRHICNDHVAKSYLATMFERLLLQFLEQLLTLYDIHAVPKP